MADYIDRQAAIDAVHEEFDDCLVWDESGETTANEFERILDYLPSADVVEVVRCKDCKYADFGECKHKLGLIVANDENYCSYGDRKDDQHQ